MSDRRSEDLDALERLWQMEPVPPKTEADAAPRWGCVLALAAYFAMVAVSGWWCWQAVERVMR